MSGAGSPLELLETPANRLPALSASLQSSLTRQLEAGSLGGSAAGNGGAASLLQGAGGARTPQQQRSSGGSGGVFVAPTSAGNAATITHLVERVIPDAIWILLAIAVGLAVGSGAAAYRSSRRARLQAGQFAAISAAALTDPLTGVLNRRGFSEAVERELARARRYDRSFVMAYVDVRGLKAVNDTEGHLVGDQLLRSVADLLKQSARADDVVGRIGGDELALLLAEQTAAGAAVVARRIRGEVDTKRRAMNLRASWDLTLGTATFPEDGQSFEELLAAADRRMYEQRGIQLR